MTTLLLLVLAIGLTPLAAGLALLKPSAPGTRPFPHIGSALLCALAFNLTFIWQELWLVIPKALTPGLHPVLYHNDHDWTGDAPVAELLQGTGALATLASGLAFGIGLRVARRASVTWRLFLFWMAAEGLYQSLSQVAIGALLPGNDVGRALAYLQLHVGAKAALLVVSVAAMGFAGVWLARVCPDGIGQGPAGRTRSLGYSLLLLAAGAVVLIVPFRVPRNPIEVVLIPVVVNLIAVGWLVFGAAIAPRPAERAPVETPGVAGPALALGAALLLFQLILRPGIAF